MEQPVIPQTICMFCEEPMDGTEIDKNRIHDFSDEPCSKCEAHLEENGYIFVSISDKSEPPYKIRRTHYCWYVDEEEVQKELPEDHEILKQPPGQQRIIFVRSSEALAMGLLTQEQFNEIEKEPDGEVQDKEAS